jgi:hypothetical protein
VRLALVTLAFQNPAKQKLNRVNWITIKAKPSNKLGKSKPQSVTKTTGTSNQYVLLSNFKALDATTLILMYKKLQSQ